MTPAEFARRIKTKYPEYAQLNDTTLTQRVIAKYPEYRSLVQTEPTSMPQAAPQPTNTEPNARLASMPPSLNNYIPQTSIQQNFIKNYMPLAKQIEEEYGIPAQVTLAQAIHETGWGTSYQARNKNNFFLRIFRN